MRANSPITRKNAKNPSASQYSLINTAKKPHTDKQFKNDTVTNQLPLPGSVCCCCMGHR